MTKKLSPQLNKHIYFNTKKTRDLSLIIDSRKSEDTQDQYSYLGKWLSKMFYYFVERKDYYISDFYYCKENRYLIILAYSILFSLSCIVFEKLLLKQADKLNENLLVKDIRKICIINENRKHYELYKHIERIIWFWRNEKPSEDQVTIELEKIIIAEEDRFVTRKIQGFIRDNNAISIIKILVLKLKEGTLEQGDRLNIIILIFVEIIGYVLGRLRGFLNSILTIQIFFGFLIRILFPKKKESKRINRFRKNFLNFTFELQLFSIFFDLRKIAYLLIPSLSNLISFNSKGLLKVSPDISFIPIIDRNSMRASFIIGEYSEYQSHIKYNLKKYLPSFYSGNGLISEKEYLLSNFPYKGKGQNMEHALCLEQTNQISAFKVIVCWSKFVLSEIYRLPFLFNSPNTILLKEESLHEIFSYIDFKNILYLLEGGLFIFRKIVELTSSFFKIKEYQGPTVNNNAVFLFLTIGGGGNLKNKYLTMVSEKTNSFIFAGVVCIYLFTKYCLVSLLYLILIRRYQKAENRILVLHKGRREEILKFEPTAVEYYNIKKTIPSYYPWFMKLLGSNWVTKLLLSSILLLNFQERVRNFIIDRIYYIFYHFHRLFHSEKEFNKIEGYLEAGFKRKCVTKNRTGKNDDELPNLYYEETKEGMKQLINGLVMGSLLQRLILITLSSDNQKKTLLDKYYQPNHLSRFHLGKGLISENNNEIDTGGMIWSTYTFLNAYYL